jgi:SAM-dependent methyltransferase
VCGESPPLPYENGSFGGLFGFSVLTHIPPDHHRRWYEEFRRILRPGGVAFVTTHGAWEAAKSTEEAQRRFQAGGAAFDLHPAPNHYKDSSIVSPDFTREAMRGLLDVVDYAERGYLNQDAWTLRRPPEGAS